LHVLETVEAVDWLRDALRAFERSGHGLQEDHDGAAAVEAVLEGLGPA
jgi:hypothetical protein